MCEQPPAQAVDPRPDDSICHGTDEQVRTCVQQLHALWDRGLIGQYVGEVDKRATEDRCLQRYRDAGAIR